MAVAVAPESREWSLACSRQFRVEPQCLHVMKSCACYQAPFFLSLFQMVTSSESSMTNQTGTGVPGVSVLSARWAKLRADPALQRSAALRARLARRERRNRQRILRLQEFHRLRSMVPTIAQTPNVDKVSNSEIMSNRRCWSRVEPYLRIRRPQTNPTICRVL